jgi:hypothetical protein
MTLFYPLPRYSERFKNSHYLTNYKNSSTAKLDVIVCKWIYDDYITSFFDWTYFPKTEFSTSEQITCPIKI